MNRTVEQMFTPAQAALLTGVHPDKQRLWRARGFLPARTTLAQTRYNMAEVVQLACIETLSCSGLALASAAEVVQTCGRVICAAAAGAKRSIVAISVDHSGVVVSWHAASRADEEFFTEMLWPSSSFDGPSTMLFVINVSDIVARIRGER